MPVLKFAKLGIRIMNDRKLTYLLPLIIGSSLAIGLLLGNYFSSLDEDKPGISSAKSIKVQEILSIIDQLYVDSVDVEKLFEESLSDMLHRLDPHSNYISAEDLKLAEESIQGRFEGIGVRFYIIRDTISITNVLEFSPSQRAGLQSGDRILKVNDEQVAGIHIDNEDVMKRLKGKRGTQVRLTILRGNKVLNKTVKRDVIPTESVIAGYMINAHTGFIKITNFSINTHAEFVQEAKRLKALGMQKLVLDLRSNPGGALGSATGIADEFLAAGKLMLITRGKAFKEEKYYATAGGTLEDTKVAILMDFNSASASEILAGALQDNDRAVIVGRRSFGKGLVQQDKILQDGSSLRLTIARYYTPTGRSIQREYDGDYHKYASEIMERVENGELYHIDSTVFENAPKKTTPGGKTVYGGGGIMPDVFVPFDSTGSSIYFTQLRMSEAFIYFPFDFVKDKRHIWRSPEAFNREFKVSDALLKEFTTYCEEELDVKFIEAEFIHSKKQISKLLKAEIARQLFTESGVYQVLNRDDNEVDAALKSIR